ncbi:MAG TPA: major capsid protein [Nocardioides sp.]|uniref:major capsid protein n=1 Tax=Nocardioides sp. TaxID=35761 RepID=UPI002C598ADF|nr:major capsid protein [Nocardioides sp.]HTW17075.1 major capsid protein [Nocardioides sp.]
MGTAPVTYPLGPPVVTGDTLTVDTALKQPTRITRRIADMTLQNFIVTRIFAQGGTVVGGAVIYDQAVLNELYLDRDVERVMPGQEFPIVGSSRRAPKVAEVEKYGGKFYVFDEARDRNDVSHFNNQVTLLANTIVRKVNTRAIAELEAAITALGGAGTFVGNDWGNVVTGGSSQTNNTLWPAADFAKAQLIADQDELGVQYDTWIINPTQHYQLVVTYGDKLAQVLESMKIKEVFSSNRVPNGTGYAVASQQVGEMRVEQPLRTETDRIVKNEKTLVQSSVRPVMYVTNPYAIKKVTGLDG